MIRLPDKCHLLYAHYRSILFVGLLGTAVGAYYTSKLSLESDLAELLPGSSPTVQALERMKEEVGGVDELRIVLETDSLPAAERLAEDLEPRLLARPLVRYVDYRNDVEFYRKNALLFLDTAELDSLKHAIQKTIDEAKQRLNPLLVEDLFGDEESEAGTDDLGAWEERYRDKEPRPLYTNEDSTVLVIRVSLADGGSDLATARNAVREIREIVQEARPERYDPDMKVYLGGNIKNRVDEYETVKSDILGTGIYGVTGVFLLLVAYFRRIVGALLITLALLCSLSWTFGATYLVIGQLNTITGFLFVILFGLGVDYGIHAFARYVESRRAGLSGAAAIERMVCRTGSALATTAVTTSAAFFSLLIMDFRGFSDLGFIAGIGMLFAFVAMVMLLPTLVLTAERWKLLRIDERPAAAAHTTGPRREFRFARGILGGAAVVTLLAAYGFSQVDFEYDFTNLRAMTREREIVSEKTRGVFTLSESPAIVLADSREEVAEIMEAVREKMRRDTLTPTIDAVRSVFSLVPSDQPARLRKIAEIRRLVEEETDGVLEGDQKRRVDELEQYLQVREPFTWEEFPEKDRRQFLNRRGEVGNFVFVYPSVPLRDGRNAIAFLEDVGTIRTASGKEFHAASSNLIAAEMLLIMIREGRIAGVLAFVVVFLLVLLDFRSLRAAILVLSPLAIGVIWMGGMMALFGMRLNFFNIVVLPTIVGIGVDNGVHIFHRYLEEGEGSLYFVLRRTGLTILMTTLTTVVGYSGLILAHHPGLASIGDLAVIGLLTTFLAAVIVLPALIQVQARALDAESAA